MVIYIGNLPFESSENDLKERFKQYGQVTSVDIKSDKFSGDPLGFAFIEMPIESAARAAIAGLTRTRFGNRIVMVRETAPRIERRDFATKLTEPTFTTKSGSL